MISFIHAGGPTWASFRYRAAAPARWIGASLNDPEAERLVFSKPAVRDLGPSHRRPFVVDYCDPHLSRPEYRELAGRAAAITCPTPTMAEILKEAFGREAVVIPDAPEFPLSAPHCRGARLLWFGHAVNADSLARVAPALRSRWPLRVVSNIAGAIPWSLDVMRREFVLADIVVLPATAPHKSANRAIEAVRQGCFVVAEPHPALVGFPGLWIGDIVEGVEWALANLERARAMTATAQAHVEDTFSPELCARAWWAALNA